MIEPCEPVEPGVLVNSPCPTCGHTMAAHTRAMLCDACDVLDAIAELRADLVGRRR